MSTIFEVLITALLTFTVGFLFLRYQPKKKALKFKNRRSDSKLLLLLLMGISVFSVISYLVNQGIIIIKW